MGVEDEFDEVRKMINRILSDDAQGKVEHDSGPFVRRFAGRLAGDERRTVVRRYLVQVPPDPGLPGPEIAVSDEAIYVTLDLGGATPTAVRTRLAGRLLIVEVEGPRTLNRIVELPHEVEPEVRWTIREAVLDLTLRRRTPRAG